MAAGGIPLPNHTHAIDCCLAALDLRAGARLVARAEHRQH